MPKLKCSVNQCAHYNEGLCSKKYIDVDGPMSQTKKDTSCKSYLYKGNDLYDYEFSKLDQKPTLQTEVYCDAVKCVYEKGQRCYADKIEIENINADSKTLCTNDQGVTHCKTFEPRD